MVWCKTLMKQRHWLKGMVETKSLGNNSCGRDEPPTLNGTSTWSGPGCTDRGRTTGDEVGACDGDGALRSAVGRRAKYAARVQRCNVILGLGVRGRARGEYLDPKVISGGRRPLFTDAL